MSISVEAYLRELGQINSRFSAAVVKAHEERTVQIIQLIEKSVKTDNTSEIAPTMPDLPAPEVQT